MHQFPHSWEPKGILIAIESKYFASELIRIKSPTITAYELTSTKKKIKQRKTNKQTNQNEKRSLRNMNNTFLQHAKSITVRCLDSTDQY